VELVVIAVDFASMMMIALINEESNREDLFELYRMQDSSGYAVNHLLNFRRAFVRFLFRLLSTIFFGQFIESVVRDRGALN
jgi:hypothetical protein